MLPIISNHDYSEIPKGKITTNNNKIILEFREGVSESDLFAIEPGYIIQEVDTNGNITKAELIEFSLVKVKNVKSS